MPLQKSTGIATGRGFDANGLCGRALTFYTAAMGSGGGAGWYLHDDQRALGTNPYIVLCDKNLPAPNVEAQYKQIQIPSATSGQINVRDFVFWDRVNHVGYGQYSFYPIRTLDASDFLYDFRGGDELFMLATRATTVWNFAGSDVFQGIDAFVEPRTVRGVLATANYSGPASSQFWGLSLAGQAGAIDGTGKTYITIVLVSGTTYLVRLYNDSGRTNLVAQSGNFSGLAEISVSLSQVGGSGVSGTIRLSAITTAGNIDFSVTRLTLQPGEAALFTNGNGYFVNDFSRNRNLTAFLTTSGTSGDDLIVGAVYHALNAGAVVEAYQHRYATFGFSDLSDNRFIRSSVPYYSMWSDLVAFYSGATVNPASCARFLQSDKTPSQVTFSYQVECIQPTWENAALERMNPDYLGRYSDQQIGICEMNAFGGNNNSDGLYGRRLLGFFKNLKVTARSTLAQMSTGMTIEGIDYLYMASTGIFGNALQTAYVLIRDEVDPP